MRYNKVGKSKIMLYTTTPSLRASNIVNYKA